MKAPIAQAMSDYGREKLTAFHTPGHKQGKGAHYLLKDLVTAEGLKEDVSLADELDDLHQPSSCIKDAQELAAKLYGAKAAFFSVNGTTGAIHAMIMAALSPGDKVLMPRNIHRSILGAMVLSDINPVFIAPEIYEDTAMGISVEAVQKAVDENPDAKALILVSPTYWGVCPDVKKIAEIVHEKEMLLLVDEAHGAHLKFSEKLPAQSIDLGADISAVSTHKLLGALTGASMLLVGTDRVSVERVRRAMSLLTTTSPNQLMLASLDIARLQIEDDPSLIDAAVDLANELRRVINEIRGLSAWGKEITGKAGAFAFDATKIAVNVRSLGISGIETAKELRARNIVCEMADPYHILLVISYADIMKQAHAAIVALMDIASKHSGTELYTLKTGAPPAPKRELTPREAFFAPSQSVSFARCVGRIAAEEITPYPPGVPLVFPGEIITKEMAQYIAELKTAGFKITGPADTSLRRVRVVAKEIPNA